MKISYKWLREYVNTKVRPESLARWLTMAGHEVVLIERKEGDYIFDIEVTPNRPDCLSHIGIAREISAITGKTLKPVNTRLSKAPRKTKDFKIVRQDKGLCPLYTLRVINNIKVADSPKGLVKRLRAIGLNPINNIVDVTNFVLFETGHPLHAFDLDKITGDEIIVRHAKENESIVTIDGVERKLKTHMLVIADTSGPVAIAGVMGGKDSAITDTTTSVLLESAYFDPVSIRRASFELGLSTDSSYRFERGADLKNVVPSSHRAASLICNITKARAGGFSESGKTANRPVKIILRTSHLNKILGTSLKPAEIRGILARLGYVVKGASVLEAIAPSYRSDTTREADLVEEVARIYGYEHINPVPASIITTDQEDSLKALMKKRSVVKEALVSSGFSEAVSYSLIARGMIKDMLWQEEDCVQIKNPLSKEQEIMRPSLLPGIIKAAAYNISRQVYDIKLFELSNIYIKDAKEYKEEPHLALAAYSKVNTAGNSAVSEQGFFQLKGVIINLAAALGIKNLIFEKTTSVLFDEDHSVAVLSGSTMLGSMGKLRDGIACNFNIIGSLFAAEMNFTQLALSARPERYYKLLPRFPYTYRDISFAIDDDIAYQAIESLVKRTGGNLVEAIELLNEYRGKQIEAGKRSLAIRVIFRSKDKTLAEEEIAAVDTAIRNGIEKTFNAVLR